MKHALKTVALALGLVIGAPLHAACYADYKAKQDNPLQLHYGVIELPDAACADRGQANQIIRDRIARGGWQLLNVVSTFGADGLGQRKDSAGDFYLRF